jgi:hypothetical protein
MKRLYDETGHLVVQDENLGRFEFWKVKCLTDGRMWHPLAVPRPSTILMRFKLQATDDRTSVLERNREVGDGRGNCVEAGVY